MKVRLPKFFLCLAIIICCSFISANAENLNDTEIDNVYVFVNDEQLVDTSSFIVDSTTYVPAKAFSKILNQNSECSWDDSSRVVTITAENLEIKIPADRNYLYVNDRYFYLKNSVIIIDGVLYVPVRELAKAFDATVEWDSQYGVKVTRGCGYAQYGSNFYNQEDLYWLSRIINAESRGEPLDGKIAVGNVVMNRAKSPQFPNTIYGVIFDRKNGTQFQPVSNKSIYNEPNTESIIAAKICLEGYSLSNSCLYFQNPAIATSTWISRNRFFVMTIGRHSFYA